MQQAETVLNVIRERGERGLPLENIYRLLYNRNLYLRAYGRIYSNQGATTKGVTAETVDGMSLAKIDRIIDEPCVTSGSGGRRFDGSTFPSPTARPAPWAYRRGRTSCCKRSSG